MSLVFATLSLFFCLLCLCVHADFNAIDNRVMHKHNSSIKTGIKIFHFSFPPPIVYHIFEYSF